MLPRLRAMLRGAGAVSGLIVYWIAAALLALLAIELCLALLAPETSTPPAFDPLVGFSSRVPLFERATRRDGEPVYRVVPARLASRDVAFPEREFLVSKPANGFRIFVAGGSSEAGFPYPPAYGFGAWLERRLGAALPDAAIEVVNAAMPGYGSRRILLVTAEIARYQPDLLIVSCGHNEWAERNYYGRYFEMPPWLFGVWERVATTRLFGALSQLRRPQRLDANAMVKALVRDEQREFREMFAVMSERSAGRGYATAEEMRRRDELYRQNLERMVGTAQQAGARVALLGIVQNLADWSPGASSHRVGLGATEESDWDAEVLRGERAAERGDCAAALANWQRALAIDDEYAELHFRIGECYRALGDFEQARASFRRASDLDRVPHGAPSRYNDVLRDVARSHGALFIDVESRLEQAAPDGLLGDELFVDFVHPNLRAQQLIAAVASDALREANIPRAASAWLEQGAVPAPELLYAKNPELRRQERLSRTIVCALARRSECTVP